MYPFKRIFIIYLIILTGLFTACKQLSSDNLTLVTIDTGLIIKSNNSKALQTDVTSFRLTVTADGMATVEKEFTDDSISLEITAGPARIFTLQALDANGNVLFSGNTTVDLTGGASVNVPIDLEYAGFYITFETDGGSVLPVLYVQKGGTVSIASAPVKTGYSLEGWYADEAFTTVWDLASDPVTADITLYAKWGAVIPDENLIARWSFDGSVVDEVGGYDATGAPAYSGLNPGKGYSQSLYFDGTHMLSVPAIDLTGQFSLSVWVNFSGGTTVNTIFSNNTDTGNSDGFKLYINNWSTSDKLLIINTGDGSNQADISSSPYTVETDGSWHHIVFLLDKTNSAAQIYLDNVSVAAGAILNSFAANTDLKIGGIDYLSSGTFFFNGYMSDMRLYSGLLSGEAISAIYNE